MILAGDIGGTRVRLALAETTGGRPRLAFLREYASGAGPSFPAILGEFLKEASDAGRGEPAVQATCLGVAGPVVGRCARFTNVDWTLEAESLERGFPIGRVTLVNDFVVASAGVDVLDAADRTVLQAGEPLYGAPRLVIGAGTGLGVAFAVADGSGYRTVPGEGGHVAFAPVDEIQCELWRWLRKRFGRVDQEHVVSGPGLARIHAFLAERAEGDSVGGNGHGTGQATPAVPASPERVARNAMEGRDPLASAAVDLFLACYGAVAGDHALSMLTHGGVFVTGGVAQGILPRMRAGPFLPAFNDKGAFSGLARGFPVSVVDHPHLGLLGAAAIALRG